MFPGSLVAGADKASELSTALGVSTPPPECWGVSFITKEMDPEQQVGEEVRRPQTTPPPQKDKEDAPVDDGDDEDARNERNQDGEDLHIN